MEYKDYYKTLGVAKTATADEIKKSYKKLAHKYHPDVSKAADAEAKFKEVAEAYTTLKDKEKRAAYDALGTPQAGQRFRPPPEWGNGSSDQRFSYDDIDLSDLFSAFGSGRNAGRQGSSAMPGQDYEVAAEISLEDAFNGTILELNLSVPEYDQKGRVQHVPRTFKTRIPQGVTDKQRLRLRNKGGKGFNGGADGDLYLNIRFRQHALFRADGHDLYVDLPITPWEAALGASVEVPTLSGAIKLKITAGTNSGQKLRLAKKGLPKKHQVHGDIVVGDLYAIVQIVVPAILSEQEKKLFEDLAESSTFNPRPHFR